MEVAWSRREQWHCAGKMLTGDLHITLDFIKKRTKWSSIKWGLDFNYDFFFWSILGQKKGNYEEKKKCVSFSQHHTVTFSHFNNNSAIELWNMLFRQHKDQTSLRLHREHIWKSVCSSLYTEEGNVLCNGVSKQDIHNSDKWDREPLEQPRACGCHR